MIPKSASILITGATGLLGSYICRYMVNSGYTNICCIKRPCSDTSLVQDVMDKIQWFDCDLKNLPMLDEIVKGKEVIIHAAAVVSFSPKQNVNMRRVTVGGTADLVNLAIFHNVKKFIHISSVAAIGRKKLVESIDENFIFSHSQYDTYYGLSKFLSEQEVWRGHVEGLNTTILNPPMILGAGKWEESSIQFVKRLYGGQSFYPTGGTGWVDVRDVCKAVLLSLTEDHNGERFIVSGSNHTYKEMFEKVSKALMVNPPTRPITKLLGQILYRIEYLRSKLFNVSPLLTKETLVSMSCVSTYQNGKSISKLGLEYIPIEKTIEDMTTSFLNTYPKNINFGLLPIATCF